MFFSLFESEKCFRGIKTYDDLRWIKVAFAEVYSISCRVWNKLVRPVSNFVINNFVLKIKKKRVRTSKLAKWYEFEKRIDTFILNAVCLFKGIDRDGNRKLTVTLEENKWIIELKQLEV